MDRHARIYVAHHHEMAGRAIVDRLREAGFARLLLPGPEDLDLTRQDAVRTFFRKEQPEYVFLAAGKQGGIKLNLERPADLLIDNLQIELNVIDSAWKSGAKRLLYLASSCVYPRLCPQPMKEDSLLTGPFEPTNEAYSIAKLAGIQLCRALNRQYGAHFIPAIPTNIYGPHDDFGEDSGHVCSALMRRMHECALAWKRGDRKPVQVWGTGSPRREFMHAHDLADACLFLMEADRPPGLINIGSGDEISIRDLVFLIKDVAGFPGEVFFDTSRPDGMPLKSLDTSELSALGWKARIPLREGLRDTYAWYLESLATPAA